MQPVIVVDGRQFPVHQIVETVAWKLRSTEVIGGGIIRSPYALEKRQKIQPGREFVPGAIYVTRPVIRDLSDPETGVGVYLTLAYVVKAEPDDIERIRIALQDEEDEAHDEVLAQLASIEV